MEKYALLNQERAEFPASCRNLASQLGNNLVVNVVTLDLPERSLIDYWKVDLDWDGQVFQSVIQAIRPRKLGPIPTQLELPERDASRPVCVRVVDIHGNTCNLKP